MLSSLRLLARVSLAAAALLAAPGHALQSTLVADLEQTLDSSVVDGLARPRGVALGRLWIDARRPGEPTRVWTVAAPGAEPQPFQLTDPSGVPVETGNLRGVTDLGSGRALLAVQLPSGFESALYSTDGTVEGTFALPVMPAFEFSSVLSAESFEIAAVAAGRAYLIARTGAGNELVVTDGTAAGTEVLVSTGFKTTSPMLLGGRLVFADNSANPGSSALRLRALDMASGAVELLTPEFSEDAFFDALQAGDRLVFRWRGPGASAAAVGIELWSTDGTAVGTGLLADIEPGSPGSSPSLLAGDGTEVYLSALTTGSGRELWRTDGTAAGTVQVAELMPGQASGLPPTSPFPALGPLAAFAGDVLVFAARDGLGGLVPYVSDGTAAGTQPLANAAGGAPFTSLRYVTSLGDRVAFSGRTAATGFEPFLSDGIATASLGDLRPGPVGSDPNPFVAFGGHVYFGAENANLGRELWVSTGGVATVFEIGTGAANLDSTPGGFVEAADGGYFVSAAQSPGSASGVESILWRTDGTTGGTVELTRAAAIQPLGALDRGLVFMLRTDTDGYEPWFTDGTPSGTVSLGEIEPGSAGSWTVGYARGVQLGQRYLFTAFQSGRGAELWSTDGTAAGTMLAVELGPGAENGFSSFQPLVRADELAYFGRVDATSFPLVRSLWATDGTQAGTLEVDPSLFATGSLGAFAAAGERLVFALNRSDGSFLLGEALEQQPAATVIASGTGVATGIAALGETLIAVFRDDATSNHEVRAYSADGSSQRLIGPTEGGQVRIAASAPSGVHVEVFVQDADLAGRYFTDGTPDGTERYSTQASASVVLDLIGDGSEAVFSQFEPASGVELFTSDGTLAGTRVLADVESGSASSSPVPLGRAGERYLFRARQAATGIELHGVDLKDAAAFVASAYGQGCGSAARPDLCLVGDARLGQSVVLRTADSKPLAPVAIYSSLQPAAAPFGGCTLYLGPAFNLGVTQTDPGGVGDFAVTIPAVPALVGLEYYLQSAVIAIGGPALGAFELSQGLELVFAE